MITKYFPWVSYKHVHQETGLTTKDLRIAIQIRALRHGHHFIVVGRQGIRRFNVLRLKNDLQHIQTMIKAARSHRSIAEFERASQDATTYRL